MRIYFVFFLLLLSVESVFSQVNLQTGAAEQGFPLINYVDSKAGLSFGVGLSYSSGNGLLVNEIASEVGTGWSLQAAGAIIRLQNGEPDDQPAYFSGQFTSRTNDNAGVANTLKNYPSGYLYNTNVGLGCNQGLNYYPVFSQQNVYKERNLVAGDVEQDKFVFNMNGRSGVFVIGKNGVPAILGDSRMKVTFTTQDMTGQGIRTTINKFIITTEDGIKYTFAETNLSRLCRYKYSVRNASGQWVPVSGDADNSDYAVNRFWGYELGDNERPYIITTWYLTSMENTNNGQKILFGYQTVYNDMVLGKIISHQRNLNYRSSGGQAKKNDNGKDWLNFLSNPANAQDFSWNINQLNRLKAATTTLVYNHSAGYSKQLLGIDFPNGGHVTFEHTGNTRVDLPGERPLMKIEYSIKGVKIRSYEMEYGYLFKNSIRPYTSTFSGTEAKFARLCLLSIRKVGNGDDNASEPPYRFSYYTGNAGKTGSSDDIVPAVNFLSQDHWGYYNGSNSGLPLAEDHDFLSDERTQYFKATLPMYKTPKDGYAKNGLLHMITYPTGGTLEYIYQQNVPSQNVLPAGYPAVSGGVSVIQTILYDGNDISKNIIRDYFYKTANGQPSRWGDEKPSYYSFSVNKFDLKFSRLSTNKAGLTYPEMATSADFMKVLGKALLNAAIGIAVEQLVELAIKQIFTAAVSSAVIPVLNIVMFVYSIAKFLTSVLTPLWSHRFILSNVNNSEANPFPRLYSSVEVRDNSPTGYNGKTFYQFTDLTDYGPLVPSIDWPYVRTQRLANWVYGLPKKVTVFDKNNNKVQESTTNYGYIVSQVANQNNFNCNCATVYRESQRATKWENYDNTAFTLSPYSWMTPRRYFPYTGRTDMLSTIENNYNTAGALYYQNTTNIITDPLTLLQKGKIVADNGPLSLIVTMSYYPTDFTFTDPALDKLRQNNAIQIPVSTETWKFSFSLGSPHTRELLDATVTEFHLYTFGSRQEVKPIRVYRLKSKTPVPLSSIGMHNPGYLLRVPSLYRVQSEMSYDDDGNLVQTKSDDNVNSFINDYSSRYVVASATNASYSDISYCGFESDGKGNWTFNPAFIKSSYSITGTKSFQLGYDPSIGSTSTITRTGLATYQKYYLTYWLRYTGTESVTVNGQAGELLYTGPDGWRLYRHEITNTGNVTIEGTGLVDELRMYPKGSLMSTVSYKEGIGKITDCDANNRMVYYEYDALGRLKIVRDQNKNIIKTYEYNYKK